jgi:pyrroloquinoline quinone biosynthesis protein D
MAGEATGPAQRTRILITAQSKPGLPVHIKLRHDAGRGRWHVLAPERVFEPDPIAVEILKRCDGQTTVASLAVELAKEYNAPLPDITADIISMLQELADKGVVKA